MDRCINKNDQTGFINGKFIGDNIRLITDIAYNTDKNDIPGMLMLMDFEKALNSLSWKFVTQHIS